MYYRVRRRRLFRQASFEHFFIYFIARLVAFNVGLKQASRISYCYYVIVSGAK